MFLEEKGAEFRPRVLEVLLGPSEAGVAVVEGRLAPWTSTDPVLDSIGAMGGSALALSISLEDVRAGRQAPALLCTVGSAARRGLPTASRATLAGIAPLSNTYVDSQVGGGFALRLVAIADGLVVRGQLPYVPGRVLLIDAAGGVSLGEYPELADLELSERGAFLRAAHPLARGLCVGVAAERGVCFASVATLADPPSFTGRGGLGARLGQAGLSAVIVEGEEPAEPLTAPQLVNALAASPHLRARGTGGTFELFEAFAARGDLPAEFGERSTYGERLSQRQSCPGCPTACRHVLKVGEGRVAGRFSGSFPLGRQLGLESAGDELELLAACNAVGVDAGEAGAVLVVLAEARRRGSSQGALLLGDLEALRAEILGLDGQGAGRGALALAQELDLDDVPRTIRGSAARPVSDLAALLGQCVSTRGNDPMRAFPFLSESGGDPARLARLVAPLELPATSFDPTDPAGKGRLVWWHENLANAVDVSGFCAFSFAGLVGDGFADLDDMSRWLAIPGLRAGGESLLAVGASLALLQRELAQRLGETPGADLPSWARETLERPGLWDEYRLLRGLEADGRVSRGAREKLGDLDLARHGQDRLPSVGPSPVVPEEPRERCSGRVTVHAGGLLAEHLGDAASYEGELPLSLGGVLRGLAGQHPGAHTWLWRGGETAVSVYRDGQRLALSDLVSNGDRLDLVVAISGG